MNSRNVLQILIVLSSALLDSVGSVSLLTCLSSESMGPLLSCNPAEILWIEEAYIGRTPTSGDQSFCDSPTLNASRGDCISSKADVTNDVTSNCATFRNCRWLASSNLINCSDLYTGFTYLFAQFQCLPTESAGVTLPLVIITVTQFLANQPEVVYFLTSGYPSSWSSNSAKCRVTIPANTVATWTILDIKGRLINLASGCAYLFKIYSRTVYRQWCAQMTWRPEQFLLTTDAVDTDFNIVFDPVFGSNSEGKLWMSLNLTSITGGRATRGINITCGKDIIIDNPPLTTSTTTSTTPPTFTTSTTVTTPVTTTTTSTTATTPTTTTTTTIPIITIVIPSTITTTPATTSPTSTVTSDAFSTVTSFVVPLFSSYSSQVPSIAASVVSAQGVETLEMMSSEDMDNATTGQYDPFLRNRSISWTTTSNSKNGQQDYIVWLIIGLTVGGAFIVIIGIFIGISICGARKRAKKSQRQGDVIFAWERATRAAAPSGVVNHDNDKSRGSSTKSSSAAKHRVNTYCEEPKVIDIQRQGQPQLSIYSELSPSNVNSVTRANFRGLSGTRVTGPSDTGTRLSSENSGIHKNHGHPKSRKPDETSAGIQLNPIYGYLPLTNYVLTMDGVEAVAAI